MPAAVDEDSKEAAARGVGRFLAAHEACGSGFAIVRNGKGRLHVVCNGCGNRTQYGGHVDSETLKAHGLDPAVTVGARRFSPQQESLERWLPAPAALPWWVPNVYILAVIGVGLAMIGFGVLHRSDENRPVLGTESTPTQGSPSAQAPQPTAPAQAGVAGATAQGHGARRLGKAPDLHRVVVLDLFAVGLPEGWDGGTSGGAVVFRADSQHAELRVFFEPGGSRPQQLADKAAAFLADEHPGARVGPAIPLRLGGLHGLSLSAHYRDGRERAALVSAHGYSYLILSRVDRGAASADRAASVAALQSFRPL